MGDAWKEIRFAQRKKEGEKNSGGDEKRSANPTGGFLILSGSNGAKQHGDQSDLCESYGNANSS